MAGSYEEFLKTNHVGDYYAIVDAGENQESILVAATGFSEMDEDIYTPELGYDIVLYGNNGGTVRQIGSRLHLSESAGPWYFAKISLSAMAEEADIIRWILPGSYTRNFHQEGSSSDWFPCLFEKQRSCRRTGAAVSGEQCGSRRIHTANQ